MQAVKPGQGEEGRAKQIGAYSNSVREESQVLARLAEKKNSAERQGHREPYAHGAALAEPEAAPGQVNRRAAQKQADAERERAHRIEAVGGGWPVARQGMKVHVGDQQNEKKIRLRQKEEADSELVLVSHRRAGDRFAGRRLVRHRGRAHPACLIIIASVRSGWARSHSGRRPSMGGTPSGKLSTGGGEVVAHSSVHAFHGLSPASSPERSEITILTMKISTENASTNAPIVESIFIAPQPGSAG